MSLGERSVTAFSSSRYIALAAITKNQELVFIDYD
jgi:hypothetical protein